jgi:hypothetical protein
MSNSFHLDLGPFTLDLQLDEAGIRLQRGTNTSSIGWGQVTAATLVRPRAEELSAEDQQQITQFAGESAVAAVKTLQSQVGQIFLAYRDGRNRLCEVELPAPLKDPAFLEEFQKRLGQRWLGETADREQARKKIHTAAGFFKTIFIMVALLGILATAAVVLLFGLLGPLLNLVSIQKMLQDLQDGNFTGFVARLAVYLALLLIGFFLHRVIRAWLDARKTSRLGRF